MSDPRYNKQPAEDASTPEQVGVPPPLSIEEQRAILDAINPQDYPDRPAEVAAPVQPVQSQQQGSQSESDAGTSQTVQYTTGGGSEIEQQLIDVVREIRDMIGEIRDRFLGGVP